MEYEVDSEMVSNRFQPKRVAVSSRREGHDFKKVAMEPRGVARMFQEGSQVMVAKCFPVGSLLVPRKQPVGF